MGKLVLEVFGGGGAIWGFSEVIQLRNPETQETWRIIATSFAFLFFLRWICQIIDFMFEAKGQVDNRIERIDTLKCIDTMETFGENTSSRSSRIERVKSIESCDTVQTLEEGTIEDHDAHLRDT